MSITIDAGAGTLPDGSKKRTWMDDELMDGGLYLPDEYSMDCDGQFLIGWVVTQWVISQDRYPGDWVSKGSRDIFATAKWRSTDGQWVATDEQKKTSPRALIRVWKGKATYANNLITKTADFADLSDMLTANGQPVVQMAENRAGKFSFTVVNDYSAPSKSVLSSSFVWEYLDFSGETCARVSDTAHPSAITPGMYVRVDLFGADGHPDYLVDGIITTVTGNGETVTIECGDGLAVAGKVGTTLRRNYRGSSPTTQAIGSQNFQADLAQLTNDPTSIQTVQWTQAQAVDKGNDHGGPQAIGGMVRKLTSDSTFSWNGDIMVARLKVPRGDAQYMKGTLNPYVSIRKDTGRYTVRFSGYVTTIGLEQKYSKPFNYSFYNYPDEFVKRIDSIAIPDGVRVAGDYYGVEVHLTEIYSQSRGDTYTAVAIGTTSGNGDALDGRMDGSEDGSIIETAWYNTDGSLNSSSSISAHGLFHADVLTWKDVPEYTVTDNKIVPSDTTDLVDYKANVRYLYGEKSTAEIMSQVGWAMNMLPYMSALDTTPSLTEFRTGGGFLLDYLSKLADVSSPNGSMLAFRIRGNTAKALLVGNRYATSDPAQAGLAWGAGTVPEGAVRFSSFEPKRTLKSRPSMMTLRATMSSKGDNKSYPVIVSIEDRADGLAGRAGVTLEGVASSSSVNSLLDGVREAFGNLHTIDGWEGTVVVPGIAPSYMAGTGVYVGSGIPVEITDERNGMSAYKARVRQTEYDFVKCTTTLTVGNLDQRYSSALADTVAEAYSASELAINTTGSSLYNTQYLYVRTSTKVTPLASGNSFTLGLTDNRTVPVSGVKVFTFPNGDYVAVGSVEATTETGATGDGQEYVVSSVKFNGSTAQSIHPSRRPDFYPGQTLIVCWQYSAN